MPIYEYECAKCSATIDVLQKIDEPAPAKCEKCGAESSMSRMVSRTSFILKGGGWYSDLYSSAKKDPGKSEGCGGEAAKPAASETSTTSTKPSSDSSSSSSSSSSGPTTSKAAAPTK